MRILKSGGYCSEGCQWIYCDFFKEIEVEGPEVIDGKTLKNKKFVCGMFNDLEIYRGSLNICNKIYGTSYDGAP